MLRQVLLCAILIGCGPAAPVQPEQPAAATRSPTATDGMPALHRAAALGQADVVRRLLDQGADPNALEPEMGLSPLHKAAYSGSAETAEVLLDRGAIIDLQSPSIGDTPLHDAIAFRNRVEPKLIEFLLRRGASISIRNHPGLTPIDLAKAIGDDEVVALLDAEARRRIPLAFANLMAAVRDDDVAGARTILGQDASLVHRRDDQGFAPLSRAARTGKTAMVELLLEHGADPNQLDRWMGATPGHKAAFWGHAAVLERLVAAGLDLDAQGKYNGYTALQDAVSQGHREAARVLAAAGARVDIVAHDGTSSLSIATAGSDTELLQLLKAGSP